MKVLDPSVEYYPQPYCDLLDSEYRVGHLLADLGGLTWIWRVPRLVGRYCSYLLPKHDGGTFHV